MMVCWLCCNDPLSKTTTGAREEMRTGSGTSAKLTRELT